MTDHTAIIERMVNMYADALSQQPAGVTDYDAAMGHALSASGLLEVLEKAEGACEAFRLMGAMAREGLLKQGPAAQVMDEQVSALRNAIKGVRDGK